MTSSPIWMETPPINSGFTVVVALIPLPKRFLSVSTMAAFWFEQGGDVGQLGKTAVVGQDLHEVLLMLVQLAGGFGNDGGGLGAVDVGIIQKLVGGVGLHDGGQARECARPFLHFLGFCRELECRLCIGTGNGQCFRHGSWA